MEKTFKLIPYSSSHRKNLTFYSLSSHKIGSHLAYSAHCVQITYVMQSQRAWTIWIMYDRISAFTL